MDGHDCLDFLGVAPARQHPADGGIPRFDGSMIPNGWAGIMDMAGRGHPEGHIEVLIAAAFVGGLVPGPRWFPRIAMLGLSMGVLLATAALLGPLVKPRYLLPPRWGWWFCQDWPW